MFMTRIHTCKLQTELRLLIQPGLWHPFIQMFSSFTAMPNATYQVHQQHVLFRCPPSW